MPASKYTFSELKKTAAASATQAFWEQLTQDEADHLRAAASTRKVQEERAVLVASALAALIGALAGWQVAPAPVAWLPAGIFAGIGWLGTLGIASILERYWGVGAPLLLAKLKRLADEPGLCDTAMALLSDPQVRAFRAQVLSGGRELLAGDLQQMSRLYDIGVAQQVEERHRHACRVLHGLDEAALPQ